MMSRASEPIQAPEPTATSGRGTSCTLGKNMKTYLVLIPAFALVAYAEPARDAGLSLHMLPDRVAKLSGERGGFTITDPITHTRGMTVAEVKSIFKYIDSFPLKIKDNGVWIVYTHPSSYEDSEKEKLRELIRICVEKKIRIFTCRASKLPEMKWKESQGIEK